MAKSAASLCRPVRLGKHRIPKADAIKRVSVYPEGSRADARVGRPDTLHVNFAHGWRITLRCRRYFRGKFLYREGLWHDEHIRVPKAGPVTHNRHSRRYDDGERRVGSLDLP
jgi:hypothetical protein